MAEIGIMKKLTIGGSTYTIPEYNLPIASASTLGGVKIGTGLSINSTTGVLSATGLDYDEADPIFVDSPAYGITQNDIDSWNAKVSDTKTWGDVVAPSSREDTSANRYIPQFSATNSASTTTASFILTKVEPFALGVPKWDRNQYLYAATPSANDNSTKVATTAYVDGAIPDVSGFISAETDPTVPSWAKAETKPTYTASEVGALPSTTVIPSKTSDLTNDSGFITSYTDENMKWTASTSSNTYYPLQSTSTAATSTANTLNSVSFYQYYNTAGGYRRLILGNATAWKSSGGAYGTIRLYGAAATYYGDLVPGVLSTSSTGRLTANRTWTLPDATGTIALTSQIPSVPTTIGNNTTGITASTTANATTVGSSSTDYGVTAAGSGSFTSGAFNGGSGSFSATVTSHVLSFSHTHTAATHGADSHTHTAPTLGSKVPTVSTASATVTITDPGHTHTLS